MLDELADAIAKAAWPRALGLAVAAWRSCRVPVLADLVDRIAARLPLETPPRRGVQTWWLKNARAGDPVVLRTLADSALEQAHKSDLSWEQLEAYRDDPVAQRYAVFRWRNETAGLTYRNLVERFIVLASLPHDPRIARTIARWFVDAKLAGETGERFACAFYDALASALVDLGDTRVIATLEQAGAEPRGVTVGLREHQQATAARAIAALAERARLAVPPDNAAELAAWCPLPGETNATRDDHALWREAARSDAAHLVLADHLLDRGDRRGEIISLMCAGDAENRARGLELLHRYWPQWVGELALVLDRGNCTFTRGLLEVAAIGQRTTPEWAYRKVATHRELLPMRAVRPGWSASDSGYVAFLDALVELPQRVGLRASMVDTLARRRPSWPIRALDLVVDKPVDVALLARTLPDVDAVAIVAPSTLDETTVVLVDELLEAWPRVRVHVDASRWLWHRERTALLDLVRERLEIDHGMYG